MKLLNCKSYEGKEYSLDDVRGFIPKESKGLPEGFYGGRVTQLAKTEKDGLYLCMENMEVIDIIIDEDELIPFTDETDEVDLASLTNKELESMLIEVGIEPPKRATKNDLIELLNR